MKILILNMFLLLSSCSTQRTVASISHPYKRALVIQGGNLNSPYYLGIYDYLVEHGKNVDVIVASCGASLAASIIKLFPDQKNRIKFLYSKEYQDLILNTKTDNPNIFDFAGRVFQIWKEADSQIKNKLNKGPFAVDIFRTPLIMPRGEFWEKNLSFDGLGPKIVIVAGKVLYNKSDVNKYYPVGTKFFQETLFTDIETAKYLQNISSFNGVNFPEGFILPSVSVDTTTSVIKAARLSITDPFFVEVIDHKGFSYVTGAVNIDPYNIGDILADEIIARDGGDWDTALSSPVFQSVFGYDIQKARDLAIAKARVQYWIDREEIQPEFPLTKMDLFKIIKFELAIPEDLNEFNKLVKDQYTFGYLQAKKSLEAINTKDKK